MPGWPWRKKDTADELHNTAAVRLPAAAGPAVAIAAVGDDSVAAHTIHGGVRIESRPVHLAPGAVKAPHDVDVPVAGAHNLPRPPNPIFVGRDELLTHVSDLFTPPATEGLDGGGRAAVGQAITGLGGIGKSELALHYAAGRTGRGAVVWWADAEDGQTLELALADLTYRLQSAATAAGWTTTEAAAWATGWLQAHTGWLLILDNVENPALVTPLLGALTTGDILITTRRDIDWAEHGVTPLTLDLLPRAASVQLLREGLHRAAAGHGPAEFPADSTFDFDADEELADELGNLPLALQQTAGYISANRLQIAGYLERLRAQTGVLLRKTAPGADPRRAVARVFALTLDALTTVEPAAVDLLCALAWLAPVPLPRQIITLPGTRRQDISAGIDVDELLGLLASYCLITLTSTSVAVHRLLQATVRDHDRAAPDAGEAAPAGLAGGQATALTWLVQAVPADPDTNVAGWALWRDLLPHLDALFDRVPQTAPDLDLARLLGETGVYEEGQGHHQHAYRVHGRALAIAETVLGPDHPATANALNAVGRSLRALGLPAQALPLHEHALKVAEATVAPDHPIAVTILKNLADALDALGRHTDALPLRKRALALTEAALGPDHPTTALRLDSLGKTLRALGRHTEALPLRERALAITEVTLGPDHPTTAIRLNNLAGTLGKLGRHTEALPLRERALTITEATLGPDHPTTAIRLNNLAYTLGDLGRPGEALPLQQRALAISEAALGPDHPTTAIRLDNLGKTFCTLGRTAEALPLQERALTVTEATLGPDHPETATVLENLAGTLDALGRPTDALPLQRRSLDITEAALGPDHPTTATRLNNLAGTLGKLGRHSEAAALRERLSDPARPADDTSSGPSGP